MKSHGAWGEMIGGNRLTSVIYEPIPGVWFGGFEWNGEPIGAEDALLVQAFSFVYGVTKAKLTRPWGNPGGICPDLNSLPAHGQRVELRSERGKAPRFSQVPA